MHPKEKSPEASPRESIHILTHEFMPFRGGIGVYVQETAHALSKAGKETTVWAPLYEGKTEADPTPYSVRRIPMRGKQDWPCRVQLAKDLRTAFPSGRIQGTVVLAEPGPLRLWMYRPFLRLPRPDRLVVVFHGTEIASLTTVAHRRLLLHNLLRKADRIGVVSDAVGNLVESQFPRIKGKLCRVPGAVRSQWSGLPVPKAKNHLPVWHVLQVGRISPRKGQLHLVEAVSRLPAHLRNRLRVRLVGPVGKSAYAKAVQNRASELDVPVKLTGALDDEALREAYEEADVVVMPSQPHGSSLEGLGIALLEGAHFGCPVIGTRFGGIPETMIEGETGLLVPASDVQALSGAIEKLLLHPEMAARMGEAGAAFVRRNFSWDRSADRLCGGIPG